MLWLENQYELRPQFYNDLLLSIVVLLGLWLLRRWILHVGTRQTEDTRVHYQWRKTSTYIYYITIAVIYCSINFYSSISYSADMIYFITMDLIY